MGQAVERAHRSANAHRIDTRAYGVWCGTGRVRVQGSACLLVSRSVLDWACVIRSSSAG